MTVTYQHSTTLMNKVSHLAYHGKLSFWPVICVTSSLYTYYQGKKISGLNYYDPFE